MKARGRRASALIVCLETPMKHEARVFEIASQSCTRNNEKILTDFGIITRNINYFFVVLFNSFIVIISLWCQIF